MAVLDIYVDWFVDWSVVFIKTVFESSFGFCNVLLEATIALCHVHVDTIFGFAVDFMINMSAKIL